MIQSHPFLQNLIACEISTRSNTPETVQRADSKENLEDSASKVTLEIEYYFFLTFSVKPKKKLFMSSEEKSRFVNNYQMKLKTEMCKTFEMTGFCRYGDYCSFAHGLHELKKKSERLLHKNYKKNPCKNYFLNGYCSYGYRCQYLHKDLLYKDREQMMHFYEVKNLSLTRLQNSFEFSKIESGLMKKESQRLEVFRKITNSQKN